jgi:SOUL heme-binding protein
VPGFLYYLITFAESIISVFGLRGLYEQPRYLVEQVLGQGVEIRRYEPQSAIEATVQADDRDKAASEAFRLLFRYITGANRSSERIVMTAPVRSSDSSQRISMTIPVETAAPSSGALRMRFFLPRSVAMAGAPAPLDPRLRLVEVPAATIAALRFSGLSNAQARAEHRTLLLEALSKSSRRPEGEVFILNYDPPFSIPFLRRNEVAVKLSDQP